MIMRPALIGLSLAVLITLGLLFMPQNTDDAGTGYEHLPPALFPIFPQSSELADLVEITKTPIEKETSPGSELSFNVRVENVSSKPLHSLMLEERFDSSQLIVKKALGGEIRDNLIIWDIPKLESGQGWSATYTVKVDSRADMGLLETTAYVNGEALEGMSSGNRMATSRLTIVSMPVSGVAMNPVMAWIASLIHKSF